MLWKSSDKFILYLKVLKTSVCRRRSFFLILGHNSLNYCPEEIRMKLPKKVWILWGWRILTVNILLFPLADFFKDTFSAAFILLFFGDLLLIILLIIKYKSLRITLEGNLLTAKQGLFLHKTVCIKLNHACATREFSSPLSQKLSLCTLVIYCEGVGIVLSPLQKNFASKIKLCTTR